jgi:hypothetical protein
MGHPPRSGSVRIRLHDELRAASPGTDGRIGGFCHSQPLETMVRRNGCAGLKQGKSAGRRLRTRGDSFPRSGGSRERWSEYSASQSAARAEGKETRDRKRNFGNRRNPGPAGEASPGFRGGSEETLRAGSPCGCNAGAIPRWRGLMGVGGGRRGALAGREG